MTRDGWQKVEPRLLAGVDHHCMVLVDASRVLLVGGPREDGKVSKRTYFFDFDSKTWSPGPNLKIARSYHACAMIKKDEESDEVRIFKIVGPCN